MRVLVLAACAVVAAAAVPLVAALMVIAVLSGLAPSSGAQPGGAPGAVRTIPTVYQAALRAAGLRSHVPWPVLAAISPVECDFGRSPAPGCNPPGTANAAGAQGPGQFLPATWRRGLDNHQLIPPGPPTANVRDGYATDGDADGIADPWNPADATAATARLLAANGGADPASLAAAVFAYNHDARYVATVLRLAAAFAATDASASGATDSAGP